MNYSKMAAPGGTSKNPKPRKGPNPQGGKPPGIRYEEIYNNDANLTNLTLNFGAIGATDETKDYLKNSNTFKFQNDLNNTGSTTITIGSLTNSATSVDKVILNFDGKNTYQYNIDITNQLNGLTIQNASTFPTSINNNVTSLTFKDVTEGNFPDLSGLTGVNSLRLENINIPDLEIQNLPDSLNNITASKINIKKITLSDNVIFNSNPSFFEPQYKGLCGKHALNNLFQEEKFIHGNETDETENGKINLNALGTINKDKCVKSDGEEKGNFCEGGCVNSSGWYDFNLLKLGLDKSENAWASIGTNPVNFIDAEADIIIENLKVEDAIGIIINQPNAHYVSYTKVPYAKDYVWYIDSMKSGKITTVKIDNLKNDLMAKIKSFQTTEILIVYNIKDTNYTFINSNGINENKDTFTLELYDCPSDQSAPKRKDLTGIPDSKPAIKPKPIPDELNFANLNQLFNCFNADSGEFDDIVHFIKTQDKSNDKIIFILNGAYYCASRTILNNYFNSNTITFNSKPYYGLPYNKNIYIEEKYRDSIINDIDKTVFYTFLNNGLKQADNLKAYYTAEIIGINIEKFMEVNFKQLIDFRNNTASSEKFFNYLNNDNNIVISDNLNFYQVNRTELCEEGSSCLIKSIDSNDGNDYSEYRFLDLYVKKYLFRTLDLNILFNSDFKMFYFRPTDTEGFYDIVGYTMDDIRNVINTSNYEALNKNYNDSQENLNSW